MDGKEAREYLEKIARSGDDLSKHDQTTVCPDTVPFDESGGHDGLERDLDSEVVHDEDELVSPDAMPFDDRARSSTEGDVPIDENEMVSADSMPFDDGEQPSVQDELSVDEDEAMSPDAMPFESAPTIRTRKS